MQILYYFNKHIFSLCSFAHFIYSPFVCFSFYFLFRKIILVACIHALEKQWKNIELLIFISPEILKNF